MQLLDDYGYEQINNPTFLAWMHIRDILREFDKQPKRNDGVIKWG